MANTMFRAPHYPIIYVRGYAGTEGEVEDTVADPYMGFNLGATKIRQAWTGKVNRYYFESPIVRLMKDFGYRDVYSGGQGLDSDEVLPSRVVVIHRYYDQVSKSLGAGDRLPIEDFANGLSDLILQLRQRLCGDDAATAGAFRVYLVGHSMGGLVIRCFLQNPNVGNAAAKQLVDKVFTYATPHNGIEIDMVGNVPAFLTANNADNFNRRRMAEYLGLPAGTDPVHTLAGSFDPDRFFCLIGTNSRDYTVAQGWSARAVGPYSDGLVRINNAIVSGQTGDPAMPVKLAPRAYVHRSHSGHYGIVNSEEGYQNLIRFLFGNVRIDGVLAVRDITLPPELERNRLAGRRIRASYHFEAVARVRGARWDLSRRLAGENSSVFRTYGELFPESAGASGIEDRAHHNRPQLFTAFLSSDNRVVKRRASLGFSLDLGLLVPEYEVDGVLWMKEHHEGGYVFRDKINLEIVPPRAGQNWRLRYGFDSRTPNRVSQQAECQVHDGFLEFQIPVEQRSKPGIDATLMLTARPWNV
jgi:pimeloyl-ACP methyl ester carboxylesterase